MQLIYDHSLGKVVTIESSDFDIQSNSSGLYQNDLRIVLSDRNSIWAVDWFQYQFKGGLKKDYSKIIHFEKSGVTAYGCVLKSYSPDVINNCCNLEIVADFIEIDTKIKPYYRNYKIDSIIN